MGRPGAGAWGALAATCRPVHSEPQLPHLQAGRCPCVPAGGPPLGVGGSAPRACLQGLRVWAPAAGGGPSPRRPRVLLWTWGDGSTSRPHQGTGAPPGDGGPTRGRGPHQGPGAVPSPSEAAGHTLLPGPAPGPCRAGIWGGRASGGGGTTSPLSPQCPLLCSGGQPAPPSREALVASRCGCPTVTECWRPGPGRLPRRLQCVGARFSRRGRTGVRSPDMVALGPGGPQGRPRGPWLAHRQRSVCDMSRPGAQGAGELGSRDEQGAGRGAVGVQPRPMGSALQTILTSSPRTVSSCLGEPLERQRRHPGKLDSLPGLRMFHQQIKR